MIKKLLESPVAYKASQFLWYRGGRQREYIGNYAQPRPGERVLDIGCGVGAVSQYFADVEYHGFDSNEAYVRYARTKYGSRAQFRRGEIGAEVSVDEESYDLVMANGILHHLDDHDVLSLLRLSHSALKPGGRLVTRDGCLEEKQSPFARWLLKHDRGRYVRTKEEYSALVQQVFPTARAILRRDMMRVPYSLIIFQCTK